MDKKERSREDARMIILENELEAQYQLPKCLISTGHVESTTEVLYNALKQDAGVLNQGDDVTVCGLDVARRVVKNEADMNMDGFQSDED